MTKKLDVETAGALDELAKKVAAVIEKSVDDKCRDQKDLGISGAHSNSSNGALADRFNFEELLGKKLLLCTDGQGSAQVTKSTAEVLQPVRKARSDGRYIVVLLFAAAKQPMAAKVIEQLKAALVQHGPRLRIVYVSEEKRYEFASLSKGGDLSGFYALPYRQVSTLGARARKHFGVEGNPTAVVLEWDSLEAPECISLLNPDAAMQIIAHGDFPWPEETVEDILGTNLTDGTKAHYCKEDVEEILGKSCQVLALYFGGEWW